jgi:hypothetical protein
VPLFIDGYYPKTDGRRNVISERGPMAVLSTRLAPFQLFPPQIVPKRGAGPLHWPITCAALRSNDECADHPLVGISSATSRSVSG